MKFLIQDAFRVYNESEKESLALDSLGIDYKGFGCIPFTNKVTGLESSDLDEPLCIRCGTKLFDMVITNDIDFGFTPTESQYNNFVKGLFYDEVLFDQSYYGKLDLPLLNINQTVYKVADILDTVFYNDIFIKPSNDRKSFTAGILEQGNTLRSYIHSMMHQAKYIDDDCIVNTTLYDIKRECRFFCIDGEVITGSHYRINNITKTLEIDSLDTINEIANEYAPLYKPSDVYTMDIAELVDGTFKIVEYNCFNASGLYKSDVIKLFNRIKTIKEHL